MVRKSAGFNSHTLPARFSPDAPNSAHGVPPEGLWSNAALPVSAATQWVWRLPFLGTFPGGCFVSAWFPHTLGYLLEELQSEKYNDRNVRPTR